MPLFFYLAVAVKLSSRGPIIYGHERIGRYGRRFKAWKFRTMFQDSNLVLEQYLEDNPDLKDEWERDHKLRYDPRITRIGRFLRKTSLDELPQLWNVIRGDMSLVGPRPIVTKEIEKYGPYFGLYTMVKPGITGLWQVSGPQQHDLRRASSAGCVLRAQLVALGGCFPALQNDSYCAFRQRSLLSPPDWARATDTPVVLIRRIRFAGLHNLQFEFTYRPGPRQNATSAPSVRDRLKKTPLWIP